MSYHIRSLYSGSSGNAVLLSAAGVNILIDAGKSARSLCTALNAAGADIKGIDAIFITHEHADHTGALEIISKKYSIPVHMTAASASGMHMGEYLRGAAVIHTPLFNVSVGALEVTSFTTSHDSACCVGYKVEFDDDEGHHAVGLATDTGCVTESMRQSLTGCESVILECNHDPDLLRFGPYPYQLKQRIGSRYGHLSNDDCAAFAALLAESGTRRFLLAHLSRENNTPTHALAAVRAAVPDESIDILVASPDVPVELI
ncbi:MAG: MBL fold metallo-hydrolase [Clostridia bacterium]|nr:MBL fold metallo-hydrolase [Clostridia bacterium]